MADLIHVQVVSALPDAQHLVELSLPQGSTVLQALEACGLAGVDPVAGKFGIYGKQVKTDVVLREHDRVEVYRPLIADPKEVRKARAAEGKAMKKGGAGPKSPA